ncbi:DUF4228 domain-containing protein [Cephalotus follicularis]|uniref:DUF4228 domain-containing protein n=1 Tax=Cephalotus follicularis TaxID=3775 RepID=A0A1Q3D1T7_CEPFO|nr:DUF4228 domain-containing protein [Cephalotus follicularis]
MGNCLRHNSSSMVWAGDDWGSVTLPDRHHEVLFDEAVTISNTEKKMLLDDEKRNSSTSLFASSSTREMKIKITKRELEELIRKVDMQGLSLEQVLAQMINGNDGYQLEHQRSWRPVLQSIPEVN